MNQVDLELRLKTEKADAQVAESAKRGRDLFEKKGFKLNIRTGDLPLGRITGDFEKFQGSLDAATARVLAFTATTTVVYGLATAFTRLFTDSVKLEKQLASIQSILQTSNSNLQKFSSELFKVANATGQSFDVAAEAASEFARQGLSVEETLKATNAALVFSKIAGADAAQAVENLTASINTFGNEALSYTDVVDTIVSLDNAFAISAAGIADGLKRVGSVASESGIQLKEIASLISVVQQVSARGAPVISNGLKTIFTRLGRSKVQESLNSIGVSTQDANGEFRSQIDILTDLSNRLDSLSDSQRAFILEQVAGVYQINTLQATLKSLNGEYSLFDKAVKVASDSSGNAAERLKILTNTTDANLQKLKNNVTQFLAETGKATVKPLLDNFVGIGNFILDAFNLGSASKEGEEKGFTIGSSILNGISAALTGPGTILIVATIGKLLGKVTKDAFSALQTLSGLKQASLVDSKTQESINEAIAQGNKGLVARLATTTSIVEKMQILDKLLTNQSNKKGIAQINQAVDVALSTNKIKVPPKGKAKGYMPNYALGNIPNSVPKTQEPIPPEIRREEKMDALGGRYKSGKVRQVPEGYMNDAELRTKIPGGGPNHWILPPLTQNGKPVKAGEDFREKAIRTKGIDPYQATGFIPNFAPALKKKVSSKTKPKNSKDQEEEEEFETIKIGETPGDRAKREFRIRKNTNIEPDDLIKIYPLNIEPVDLSQETKNLKKQEVKGSGFTKRGTAYENDVLNYFSSRKVNPINFDREGMFGGKTSAVDGYRISPNENQTLDLLEVKSGSFSKLSVANKFKRFIPENINKIPELESLYKENQKTPQDTISIRPYLAIPDKSKYKNDSKGFIPNFASRYTEARKQKRDELRASLFNIGDFAGGEIKNVNAQTEFNQARDKNPNVEFDDKINQVGFKVERIPIPDREFEAALRSKENNKEVTTKFENYAIDYLNTKGYSFKPGRDTLYGKENAAVDGYNIKQNFIELLEVKGGKWDAPDVNNKFGRFAPENLVDLGPQLVSKFFKEGNPDPNINDKIRIRNVLAIPNLTGGVFKKNIAPQYPSADVKAIEKARQSTRKSGSKIPAKYAWMVKAGLIPTTNSSGFIPNFALQSSMIGKGAEGTFNRLTDDIGVKRFHRKAQPISSSDPFAAFEKVSTKQRNEDLKQTLPGTVEQEYIISKLLEENQRVGIRAPKIFGTLRDSLRRKSIRKEIIKKRVARDSVGPEASSVFGGILRAQVRKIGLLMSDLHGGNYTLNSQAQEFIEKNKNYLSKDYPRTSGSDESFFNKFVGSGGEATIIDAGYASILDPKLKNRANEYKKGNFSSGFIPNFASVKSSPYVKSVMGLEERMSGKKAVLDYDSSLGPYIRNTGQRNLSNALADHGGLKNAMKDSVAGQQSAGLASGGFVPNFAAPPPRPISLAYNPAHKERKRIEGGLRRRGHQVSDVLGAALKTLPEIITKDRVLGNEGEGVDTAGLLETALMRLEGGAHYLGPRAGKLVYDLRKRGYEVTESLKRKLLRKAAKVLGPKFNAEGFIPNFATAQNKRDEKRKNKRDAAIAAQSKNIQERKNKTSAAQAKVAAVRARPVLPSRLRSGLGGSFQATREIFERKQAERKAAQATAGPTQRSILTTAQLRKNSSREQSRRNAKVDYQSAKKEMSQKPQVTGRYQPTLTGQMQSVSRKDIFKNITQDRINAGKVGGAGGINDKNSAVRNRKYDSIKSDRIAKRLERASIKTPGGMYGSPTLPTKGIQGMGKGINGFPRTQIENRFQVERDARAARVGPTKVRRSLNNINRIRKADQQGFLNSGAQKTTARGVPSAAIPRPTIVGGSGGPPRGPGGGGPPRGPGGGGPPTGPGGGGPPNGPGGGGPPDGPDENDEKKKGKGKKMGGGMPGGGALIASMLIPAITGALVNPDESKRTNAEKITAGVADAAGVGIMTTSMLAMAGVAPGIGIAIGAVVGGFKLLNTTLKATVPSTKEQAAANDALVKKNEKSLASLDSALRSSEDVKQLRNSGGDPKKIAKAQLEFSKSLGRIGDKDVVNALTNEKDTGKREQVISDFQEKKRKETELSQSSFAIAQQANQVQTASAGFGVDDIKGLFSMGGYKETAPSFEAKDWDTFLNPIVDSLDFTKDKSGEAAIAMKRIMSGKDTDLAGFLKRFGTQLGMTSGAVMTATQTIKQLNGAYNPTSLANMAQYGAILMDNNATISKGQSANAPVLDVNFQKVFEKATQNLQLDTDLKSYGEMTQKTANLDLEKNKLAIDQELGILSPMQAVRKSSEMQGKENNLLFEQKGMDLLNKSVNNLLSLVPQGLDVGTQESILEASRKTLTEGGDITELESLIKNSLGTAEDSKDILEKIANFSQESAQSFSKLKIDQSSSERSRVAKEQQAIERVQAQGDVNLGKNLLDKSSNEKVSRLETSIADLRDRARKAEGTQTPRGRAMAKDLNDRADAQESQLKAMKGVDNKGQLLDPIAVAKLEEAIAKLRTAAAAKGLGTTEGRKLTDQADKKALEVQQMRESAAKKETETFGVAYTQTGAGSKDLGTKERVKKENERILDLVNKFNEESGGAFQASLPDIQNALFSGDRAGAKKLISEGLARGGENTLEKKALAGEIRATGGEAGLFGSASASNEQQPPAKWESALSKMNEQALSSRVDAGLVLMRGKTVAKDTSIAEATKAKEEEQKANTDFQAFKSLKAEELKNNSAILGEGGGKDKLQDTIKNLNTSTNTRDGVVYSDTNEIKGTKDELKKALNSVMSGSFTGDDLKNLEASKAQKTPESVLLIDKTIAQIKDLGLTFETTGEAGVKREKELQANVESAQKNSQAKMALASKAKTDFENFASNPTQRGVDFLTDSSKREDAKRKFRESNDPALKALADKMDESSKLEGQIKEVDNAPAQRRKLAADKVREELSAGGVQLGKNVEDALKGFETGAISMDDIANNGGLDKGLASKLMQYGGAKDKRDFVANTSEEVTQKETLQKALKENEISMVQQGVSQSSSINKTLYKDGQIAPGIVNTISNSGDRAKVEAYNTKIRERQAKEEELKGVDQSLMDTKGKEKDRRALSDKVKSKLKQDFESGKITGDEFFQKSKSLESFASGEVGINDGSLFNVRKDLVEQAGDPNATAQLQKESLALYQEASSLGGTGTEAGRQKISEADAKRKEMEKIRQEGEGKYEALNTGEGTVAGQKKRGAIIQEIDKSKNQETEMKKGLEGILGAMTGISNALQATVEANRVRDEAAAQAAADAKDPSKTQTVASNNESVVTLNVNVAMDGPLTPGQLAQATAGGRAAAADLGRSWAKGAGVPAPNAGPVMAA